MASAVEQTRRLMGATFEGMFIHDAGVVLDANRAAADLFGRAVKELSCCRISELLAEESCRVLMQQIHRRATQPCPIMARHKNGNDVPLEITIKAVLTCGGRRLEVLAVSECVGVGKHLPGCSSPSRN
jgi:PAS domain S-box-containing protein